MKGIVFTEFLEMVEDRLTPAVADRIIEAATLPSGGAYTAVGTYDHHEMVQLVAQLSTATGIAVPELLHAFGEYLFGRFVFAYPRFFVDVASAFDFLERVETHIHTEVRKLYPNAELPTFTCEVAEPHRLTLTYQSVRPFADLAAGLITGCIKHFGEVIDVHEDDLSQGHKTCVRFVLTRRG